MVLCGKNVHTMLLTFSSVNQSYLSLSKADAVIAVLSDFLSNFLSDYLHSYLLLN